MKKYEYDALLKVVNFLKTARSQVADVSETIRYVVGEAEKTLVSNLDGLLEEANSRLDSSPLEDPVVPTAPKGGGFNWGGLTDAVNDDALTRSDKEEYILETAVKVGNTVFSDEDYVRNLKDTDVDVVYKALKATENLAEQLKKAFRKD